jgi:hypothetical protein
MFFRRRGARHDFAPESIELCYDKAIGKARPVDAIDESAVTTVARAHDGQMRRRCQVPQVGRGNHRIVFCEQHGRRTAQRREPRSTNFHQRCRRHGESINRKTARQGTAHVLDKPRRPSASAGPMRGAQRRVASTISAVVPGNRHTPDRPPLELATPPFLTVPNDSVRSENVRSLGKQC